MPKGVRGFQKGAPRNPKAGRQKGTLNKRTLFLQNVFEDEKFDWKKDFTDAIINSNQAKITLYSGLLKYLVAELTIAPLAITVDSPEASVSNAKEAMELIKNLEKEHVSII